MTELKRVDDATSAYAEARQVLNDWEAGDPRARRIVMILDGEESLLLSVTGVSHKPTDIAGLCFAAAQMAVEE